MWIADFVADALASEYHGQMSEHHKRRSQNLIPSSPCLSKIW